MIVYGLTLIFFLLQSVDLTELAKQGKLDPIIGRDEGTQLPLYSPYNPDAYTIS
jgi:hypothetical protein